MSTKKEFGGSWTAQKLDILERYLDAYTTALKSQPFRLIYIDAFAGSGQIDSRVSIEEAKSFIEGSAKIALDIGDKQFDEIIFNDKDQNRCQALQLMADRDQRVQVLQGEANQYLRGLKLESSHRGVLFLDPFATQVDWATIEKIAALKALDAWILFPIMAITRLLPRDRRPETIDGPLRANLNRIFGNASWEGLYHERSGEQTTMFDDPNMMRGEGTEGIIRLYKGKLKELFGDRFLPESKTLKNSQNAALFEFIFCAGHPKGADTAKRIAKHIIRHF